MFNATTNYISYTDSSTIRKPLSKIKIGENEYDMLTEYPKVEHSTDRLCGSFPSKVCTFAIYCPDGSLDLIEKNVDVYRGLNIGGTPEWVPMGNFSAKREDITTNVSSKTVRFKGYDKSVLFDVPFNPDNHTYPCTLSEFVQVFCQNHGIALESPSFPMGSLELSAQPEIGENVSERELIASIAALGGCIAQITRDGKLRISKPQSSGRAVQSGRYKTLTHEKTVYVTKVVLSENGSEDVIRSDNTHVGEYGEFVYRIKDNPFIKGRLSDTADAISENILGLSVTPFEMTEFTDDFIYDLNDEITVTDKAGNTFTTPILSLATQTRITSTIKATVPTEEKSSDETPIMPGSVRQEAKNASSYAKAVRKAHDSFLETLRDGLSGGLYQTTIDGAIYYHNTPDIAQSTYIQTFNSAGRAWVSGSGCWNGGSPVWKYGETKDGDAILRDLLVRTLTADLIRAGKLSSFDGNTYFDLDNSEILTTGQSDAFSYVGTINAGRAVFAKSETDADTGESTVLSESILGNSGLSMQTVEPEDYVFKTPDTITVNGEEIAWSEATDVQKALYKLTDLVNYLANSAYGINILTKGKDGNNYSAHFDGMKLLLRQGYIEAKTVTAESLLFKYNENDILMSEFVDNIVVGLTVEANSDMNNITGIGRYNIEANTVAETCSNLPIVANGKAVAGYLEVFALGKTGYILQRFTPYNNEGIFTRWYNQYNSSWGSWMKYSATSVSTYTP